ncbi:spore coat U domain-containing protein [Salmonella enterica]|nr:spore coat U domain-containing protein [Salmonella enterica]EAX6581737.1 spore coat U domain-containing protein [Salmonella enterica]
MRILILTCIIILCRVPGALAETSCTIMSHPILAFGIVDPRNSRKDSQSNLAIKCRNSNTFFKSVVKLCLGIESDSNNPNGQRYIYNKKNNSKMAYNIFFDPSRSRVVGTSDDKNYNINSTNFTINARSSFDILIPFYGRVYTGQYELPPGDYTYTASGTMTRLDFSYYDSPSEPPPQSCISPRKHKQVMFSVVVEALVVPHCYINFARDLDFGFVDNLLNHYATGQSHLALTCTYGTNYAVAIDNGLYYSSGQRRMSNGSNRFIPYELYQDSGRSKNWDSHNGNLKYGSGTGKRENLIIYGKVDPQPDVTAGSYSDRVTATITY